MSRGTQVYTLRVPQELMDELRITIARRNAWTRDEPWTMSSAILAAIKEKIDKMNRSRGPRRKVVSAVPPQCGEQTIP